jgi:hypothetical protein
MELELSKPGERGLTASAEEQSAPVERTDRRAPENRRRHPRFQITTTAEFTELESGARGTARTSDLSLGGCFVDTTSPYSVGKRVKLRLTREGRSFAAVGEIVCSLPGMGMGVKFEQCEGGQMVALERWIGEMTGEAPATAVHHEDETPFQRALKNEHIYVLEELILVLMRKGILVEEAGQAMLVRLHQ